MSHDEKKDGVKDYAPHNPLSPHSDDPDYEPAPVSDDNGHGGEYDQKPYMERTGESDQTPEEGEYDQKPYIDRRAHRQPDEH